MAGLEGYDEGMSNPNDKIEADKILGRSYKRTEVGCEESRWNIPSLYGFLFARNRNVDVMRATVECVFLH